MTMMKMIMKMKMMMMMSMMTMMTMMTTTMMTTSVMTATMMLLMMAAIHFSPHHPLSPLAHLAPPSQLLSLLSPLSPSLLPSPSLFLSLSLSHFLLLPSRNSLRTCQASHRHGPAADFKDITDFMRLSPCTAAFYHHCCNCIQYLPPPSHLLPPLSPRCCDCHCFHMRTVMCIQSRP